MAPRFSNRYAPLAAWRANGMRLYLQALRAESGLSYADVAAEAGYLARDINGWERGYMCPTVAQLFDWCEALGYKLSPRKLGPARGERHESIPLSKAS